MNRSAHMKPIHLFFVKQGSSFLIPILLLFASFLNVGAATPVDSLISEANRHYANLEFDQAASLYQSVVDAGYESAGLYYNLGNAYYKMNQLAQAILFYEKALELSPYDEDIRDNLEIANMLIVDQVENIPVFFLKRWWRFAVNLFSPNRWAMISLSLFVLALLFFLLHAWGVKTFSRKRYLLTVGVIALLISILLYVFSISRKQDIIQNNHAIVMDLSVAVKSSPDELGTSVFMLHEGTRVKILDSLENWREIKIANGNKGWILKNSIGTI